MLRLAEHWRDKSTCPLGQAEIPSIIPLRHFSPLFLLCVSVFLLIRLCFIFTVDVVGVLLSYERAACARVDGRLLEGHNCVSSIPKQKLDTPPSSPDRIE